MTSEASSDVGAVPIEPTASFLARRPRLCVGLVLALAACNLFLALGNAKINDFEEARYGVTAYEMQQHHSYVVTTYAGNKELWALKPPLGYWLMAMSFALFGGSALALRLPSALCALAVTGTTLYWARRWFSLRVAIVAGLIVSTSYGWLSHHGARSGDFDACLTLILTLVAVQLPELGTASWRVVPIALLLACGFLLKSFAILPIALVACGDIVWSGSWRRQRLLPCLAAAALFAAIVGGWVWARWHADGSADFLLRMVREDVVDRSTTIVDKSTSSPLSYVEALFDRAAPWPLVIAAAAVLSLRGKLGARLRRGRVVALLVLWVAVPLLIVSFVRTQHHWYLDPIYPALAVLGAGSALFLADSAPTGWRAATMVGLVVVPLALCEARFLARVLTSDRMPGDQRFLSALEPAAAGGCREVRSTFQLAYSERFILEVMDGFEVKEPGPAGAATGAASREDCLLVGKLAWRRPPAPPAALLPGPDLLMASNASYGLYRLPAHGKLPAASRNR